MGLTPEMQEDLREIAGDDAHAVECLKRCLDEIGSLDEIVCTGLLFVFAGHLALEAMAPGVARASSRWLQ